MEGKSLAKLKVIGSLLLCILLLSACGGYKEGQEYILKDNIIAYGSPEDYQDQLEDTDGEINVDGETINMLFEDYSIKIVDADKKNKLILVEILDGSDEGSQWWVPLNDFKQYTEKKK